jgi:RNA-directed DNA polymerase
MEAVVDPDILRQALKGVRANKGSPGVDGMTVQQLPESLKNAWPCLKAALLDRTYYSQPVIRAEIPNRRAGCGSSASRRPSIGSSSK